MLGNKATASLISSWFVCHCSRCLIVLPGSSSVKCNKNTQRETYLNILTNTHLKDELKPIYISCILLLQLGNVCLVLSYFLSEPSIENVKLSSGHNEYLIIVLLILRIVGFHYKANHNFIICIYSRWSYGSIGSDPCSDIHNLVALMPS